MFSLVAVGGVEGEGGEDFPGFGGCDGGVVVVDEADDFCAAVGAADSEVEQASAVAQADLSVVVDGVVAHAPECWVLGWGVGRFCGWVGTFPATFRILQTVAREMVVFSWARCQVIVSAPASRPSAVSWSRNSRMRSRTCSGVRVGTDFGRRERGWKAASPSSSHRWCSLWTNDFETP